MKGTSTGTDLIFLFLVCLFWFLFLAAFFFFLEREHEVGCVGRWGGFVGNWRRGKKMIKIYCIKIFFKKLFKRLKINTQHDLISNSQEEGTK